MQQTSLKNTTASGLFWNGTERILSKGLQFVFSVLIARILSPSDYGIIAIVNILLSICQMFVESGLGKALVQKVDRTDFDFSTVFYFNITAAIILYIAAWLSAPLIASYYDIPLLKDTTRIVCLSLIFNAFGSIQWFRLMIEMKFKQVAIISLAGSVISGIAGLVLAYLGWGVWALATQTVLATLITNILCWTSARWLPGFHFSFKSLKEMFSFGINLLAADGLDKIYGAAYTAVIGKSFSTTDLGNYGKADAFASTPATIFGGPIRNITYPIFSSIQNEINNLSSYYRKMMRLSAFVFFPMIAGMIAVADPLIRVLLTDKWAGMIPLMQIISLSYLFPPLIYLTQNLLLILGYSGKFLKIQLITRGIGIILLFAAIPLGMNAVCTGLVIVSATSFILFFKDVKKHIGYGWKMLLGDLFPSTVLSIVMGAIVYIATLYIDNIYIKLTAGIIIGISIYIGGDVLFKQKEWNTLIELIKGRIYKQ